MIEKGILGNAIRQARIDNNFTQEELAEKVGITPTHMKHIESEHRKPSIEVLFSLATNLHMSLDQICFPENKRAVGKQNSQRELAKRLIEQCSDRDVAVIVATMQAMRKNTATSMDA